jgi:hypothetical protein
LHGAWWVSPAAGSTAARFGDWKIITGYDCATENNVRQAWPEPGSKIVPFGKSGGVHEPGTDHYRVKKLSADLGAEPKGQSSPDPTCATGIKADYHHHGTIVCCEKSCGACGVQDECQLPVKDGKVCPCAKRLGGAGGCCNEPIQTSGRMCADVGPPCVVSFNRSTASKVCLYVRTCFFIFWNFSCQCS